MGGVEREVDVLGGGPGDLGERLPAFVRDGQHAVAVLGGAPGHVVQQREDLGQRVLGPVVGEQVRRERDGRQAAVRVHARRRRPQPRVGDHSPHAHRDRPPVEQVRAGLADVRIRAAAGQPGQLRGSDHDQPQELGTARWRPSGSGALSVGRARRRKVQGPENRRHRSATPAGAQRTWPKPAAASTSSASSAGVSLSERNMSVPPGWRAAAATISSTPVMPNSRAAWSHPLPG